MFPAGCVVYPDVLTSEQQQTIISWLDTQSWNTTLKRRTQQYGYLYNYAAKGSNSNIIAPTTPLSGPLVEISRYLASTGLLNGKVPEQCIINEYTRKQGIAKHIDSPVFGPTIISISLGDPTIMTFSRENYKIPVVCNPGSLLVMTGESRYQWTHEISSNLTLVYPDGRRKIKPENYRRISLTFRTLA